MDESTVAGIAVSPWATGLAAYLFGIATGWLVWGGLNLRGGQGRAGDEAVQSAEHASASDGSEHPASSTSAKLGAIDKEIKNMRELLDRSDGEVETLSQTLSILDGSLKRANGRLKLILRAVKRTSTGN